MKYLGDFEDIELLVTHPMFGPDSGAQGVEGLTITVWPLRVGEVNYEAWCDRFSLLKLKVVEVSPEEHDRIAATTQGVTHYVARVLGELDLQPSHIATKSYGHLLQIVQEICKDSWQLFVDLQTYNSYTEDMRFKLEAALWKIYARLLHEQTHQDEIIIGVHGSAGSEAEKATIEYCKTSLQDKFRLSYYGDPKSAIEALRRGEIYRCVLAIQVSNYIEIRSLQVLAHGFINVIDVFDFPPRFGILHHPSVNFSDIKELIISNGYYTSYYSIINGGHNQFQLQIVDDDDVLSVYAHKLSQMELPITTGVVAPIAISQRFGLSVDTTCLQGNTQNSSTAYCWCGRPDV
jgi:hypothetical protein